MSGFDTPSTVSFTCSPTSSPETVGERPSSVTLQENALSVDFPVRDVHGLLPEREGARELLAFDIEIKHDFTPVPGLALPLSSDSGLRIGNEHTCDTQQARNNRSNASHDDLRVYSTVRRIPVIAVERRSQFSRCSSSCFRPSRVSV